MVVISNRVLCSQRKAYSNNTAFSSGIIVWVLTIDWSLSPITFGVEMPEFVCKGILWSQNVVYPFVNLCPQI